MRLLVIGNVHLICDKKGNYYSPSVYSYSFFKRYLDVFERVRIVGKTKHIATIDPKDYLLVSGEGLEIVELPWYQGIKEMTKVLPELIRTYRKIADNCDCCIYRIAQVESFMTYVLSKRKKPYCVEVVNDPNTFENMPRWMRAFSVSMTKKMTANANGASYVTEHYLQKIYPIKSKKREEDTFTSFYSSIDLDIKNIQNDPIIFTADAVFNIVHVSNAINSDIKGHTVLIKSFSIVHEKYPNSKLIIIGDGNKLDLYKNMVKKLDISDSVIFTGRIKDKEQLLSVLRTCNLLVLPTKMEGLPRTIIEAMAVGLPCLSTPIAGIPELLAERYLIQPDDYEMFAKKTLELIKNPKELYQMSLDNIETSKKYEKTILTDRRVNFYTQLRKVAEND